MRTWPPGLACVAESVKKAGHRVHVLDMIETQGYGEAVKNAVEEFDPDIVGISVRNIDDQHMVGTKVFLNEIRRVVEACRAVTRAPHCPWLCRVQHVSEYFTRVRRGRHGDSRGRGNGFATLAGPLGETA
ncbi:MAG: hypothetical protein QG577_2288 [Thermodesulfobacteriota bacterium]|nr:hypothetical protein [Thermodesulfobacteriota bacterium]